MLCHMLDSTRHTCVQQVFEAPARRVCSQQSVQQAFDALSSGHKVSRARKLSRLRRLPSRCCACHSAASLSTGAPRQRRPTRQRAAQGFFDAEDLVAFARREGLPVSYVPAFVGAVTHGVDERHIGCAARPWPLQAGRRARRPTESQF